ncbi:MAG: hypothetical protein ACR2JH_09155 [Solirubrobacteraceae bacterium]
MILLLGIAAWLIGEQLTSSSKPRSARKLVAAAQPSFTQFRDPGGTFSGGYPSSWQRLQSSDPAVVALAASSDGASLLVRKTPIGVPVSAVNLGRARKLTDSVVNSGKHVTWLRQPQQVTLGGLPGYLYLYTFDDPTTGQRGAHAHYFLFQGTTMVTLVFQALPAERISSLAPLFDRIASMFRATP